MTLYHDYVDQMATRLSYFNNMFDWDTKPYGHLVVDNFLTQEQAQALYEEVLQTQQDETNWNKYDNPLEKKFSLSRWDQLPKNVYAFLLALSDERVVQFIEDITGISGLIPDSGLHGGGIHMHRNGGKLNLHQDYSIHPKTGLQRRLNVIFYLGKEWEPSWGGGLELHEHNPETNRPKYRVKTVDYTWNRMVLFDTIQSWHGFPDPITPPDDKYRLSLAFYYTSDPLSGHSEKQAVLYAPSDEQIGDPEIEKLIELRSDPETAKKLYKKD
jgi:Rps23 Pro-64 3,4-dihydroxylase Tpa1-like proline 4-hydroxylase